MKWVAEGKVEKVAGENSVNDLIRHFVGLIRLFERLFPGFERRIKQELKNN